jgi:hypothetical protein
MKRLDVSFMSLTVVPLGDSAMNIMSYSSVYRSLREAGESRERIIGAYLGRKDISRARWLGPDRLALAQDITAEEDRL